MIDFRHMHGAVYIFENSQAKLVKVGMTINNIKDRLDDINNMWLERKVTCQICGGHLVKFGGRTPKHVVNGLSCLGGNELPLEKDITLAESHLENMKICHKRLSGSEKGSSTKKINTIKKRIEVFRYRERPIGVWQLNTAFYTDCAEKVELLSHEILAEHLNKTASFGEVFYCSVSEATEAVEYALDQLGLLHSARKETTKYNTSEEHRKCVICGNNLTNTGACPECLQSF